MKAPKSSSKHELVNEVVGIVISGTHSPPATTVFSAYVWAPAPSTDDENVKAT